MGIPALLESTPVLKLLSAGLVLAGVAELNLSGVAP
jgi:hypothetical protein